MRPKLLAEHKRSGATARQTECLMFATLHGSRQGFSSGLVSSSALETQYGAQGSQVTSEHPCRVHQGPGMERAQPSAPTLQIKRDKTVRNLRRRGVLNRFGKHCSKRALIKCLTAIHVIKQLGKDSLCSVLQRSWCWRQR